MADKQMDRKLHIVRRPPRAEGDAAGRKGPASRDETEDFVHEDDWEREVASSYDEIEAKAKALAARYSNRAELTELFRTLASMWWWSHRGTALSHLEWLERHMANRGRGVRE